MTFSSFLLSTGPQQNAHFTQKISHSLEKGKWENQKAQLLSLLLGPVRSLQIGYLIRTVRASLWQAATPVPVHKATSTALPGTRWPCDSHSRMREIFRKKLFTGWIHNERGRKVKADLQAPRWWLEEGWYSQQNRGRGRNCGVKTYLRKYGKHTHTNAQGPQAKRGKLNTNTKSPTKTTDKKKFFFNYFKNNLRWKEWESVTGKIWKLEYRRLSKLGNWQGQSWGSWRKIKTYTVYIALSSPHRPWW